MCTLQAVRQLVVEQFGCIAKVLCADKDASDADVAWLAAMSVQAGASAMKGIIMWLCSSRH
jgi:hypothetical protein